MPFSKTRNDIVHMDAYHRDPKREAFEPLLAQMAEDLLQEGFEDVGPQITKLTIKDEDLTKYIDEFICYYYDSSLDRPGHGACGVAHGIKGSVVLPTATQIADFMSSGTWGAGPTTGSPNSLGLSDTAAEEFTRFRLDGEGSTRNRVIDDYYKNEDWNQSLALNSPSYYEDNTDDSDLPAAHTPAISTSGQAKSKRNVLLGPNCELFHYLNPHPAMRGSRVQDRTGGALGLASDANDEALDEKASIGYYWTDHVAAGSSGKERPLGLLDGHFYKKDPPSAPEPLNMYEAYWFYGPTGFDAEDEEGTPQLPQTITEDNTKKFEAPLSSALQRGFIGLNTVCRAVYFNEFKKIKDCITNTARDVKFSPDASTAVNTQAYVTQYKEKDLLDGSRVHYFWMANYRDEFFFPAGVIPPQHYKGEILIGFDPSYEHNEFQRDDVYEFDFIDTYVSSTFTETISVKVGIDNSLEGFTQSIYDAFILSDLFDNKGGRYNVRIDPDRIGVLEIASNGIGHNLTCAAGSAGVLNRVERTLINYPNIFTYFEVVQPEITALVASSGGTPTITPAAIPVYSNGYVHEVQIRGIDGANTDDAFSITLSGLLDEEAADILLSTSVKSLTIDFSTKVALNAGQLSEALADRLKEDDYVKQYLTVTPGSNFITVRYKETSRAFMRKGAVGLASGLMAFVPSNAGVVGGNSIITGASIGTQVVQDVTAAQNGFIKADLPLQSVFTATVVYTAASNLNMTAFGDVDGYDEPASSASGIGDGDPIEFELDSFQAGLVSGIEKVRLSFPLARDMGTFSKPVKEGIVGFGMDMHAKDNMLGTGPYTEITPSTSPAASTSAADIHMSKQFSGYPLSYYQHVLQPTDSETLWNGTNRSRPSGPEVSFHSSIIGDHPNKEFGNPFEQMTKATEFARYTHEIDVMEFEYINDHSMGPLIFQTKKDHPLSGLDGEQGWRIRLDVSRGKEILESSPFINEVSLQVKTDMDATSAFEYLRVHIATEHQLTGNGKVAQPQGRDGIKQGVLREPGHLGALRPQYKGYKESAAHLVQPYVDRRKLETTLETGFLYSAGVVGTAHSDINYIPSTRLAPVFNSQVTLAGETDASGFMVPPQNTLGLDKVSLDYGILPEASFRFEEGNLVGASDELLHDTPYNSGDLRLTKGFFRRTGKSHPDIAPGYPLTYSYTLANHGMVFHIADHASVDQSDDHAFFCVQRHVNSSELSTGPLAGRPAGRADYVSDQQPLHCVYMSSESAVLFSDFDPFFSRREVNRQYSTAAAGIFDLEGNYVNRFMIDDLPAFELKMLDMETQGRFRRFIVREKDVLKPWERHVFAGINETDSFAVLNPLEQLSLNDEGQLVIQFPNRLGSQRFFYTGKELDLIAFCSAGAVGMDTLITSDRYGDAATGDKRRVYKGMMSSYEYGKGMRILMLTAGIDVGILGSNTDAKYEDLLMAPYGTATS